MPTTKKVTAKKVTKSVAAVKKATPKKAVKKPTVKAAAKKTVQKAGAAAKKELVYADEPRAFWVSNGEILNSMIALRDALDRMEAEVFAQHANTEKNDFANWVEHVLCDGACAAELRATKTPKSAKTVVARHLKWYAV